MTLRWETEAQNPKPGHRESPAKLDIYFHPQTLTTRSDQKVSMGQPELRSQDLHLLEVRPDLASGWGRQAFPKTPPGLSDETEGKLEMEGAGTKTKTALSVAWA